MPSDSNKPEPLPPDSHLAAIRAKAQEAQAADRRPAPSLPPSKPLQIFLLIALVVTGFLYALDQWSVRSAAQDHKKQTSKLKRMVELQGQAMTETKLGREAEARQKYGEAVTHFQKALHWQDTAGGHLDLGDALSREGRQDDAIGEFKEAIRQDPTLEGAYAAWSRALVGRGELDQAVRVDGETLQHHPTFGAIQGQLAEALEGQAQLARAAEREAENQNHQPEAATDQAEAERLETNAAAHYARAGELGLKTADFWEHYGDLLARRGQLAEAEVYLTKVVAQNPQSGPAQFQLASAQQRQGKDAAAIGHYEAALAAMPDDPATLDHLALIYATSANPELHSPKMAILLATRANDATTSQNARFMDTLARSYAEDGDFFQAIAWEDKAIHRASQLADRDLLSEFSPRYLLYRQHQAH